MDPLVPQHRPGAVAPVDVSSASSGEQHDTAIRKGLEVASLVRRHLPLVFSICIVCVAAAVYRMRHDAPRFEAAAVVRVADKGRALSGGLGATPPASYTRTFTDPLLSLIQVLQSRRVAEEVVQQGGLRLRQAGGGDVSNWLKGVRVDSTAAEDTLRVQFNDDGYEVRTKEGTKLESYGSVYDANGVSFSVPKRPDRSSIELIVIPLEQAVDEVRGNLRGTPRERTDIIDVTYVTTDPYLAQHVVNTTAQVFQAVNARTAKQESGRRRQFIEGQLEKTEASLAGAQEAYNSFRSREKVYSSQDKLKGQQAELSALDLRQQELEADRRMSTALLSEVTSHAGDSSPDRLAALASSPGVGNNTLVAQLFTDLTRLEITRDSVTKGPGALAAGNPDLVRLNGLIAATQDRISSAVRGQIGAIDARLAALDQRRKEVAGQLTTLPSTEAEEARFLDQVETYRRAADQLRAELQAAQINEAAEAGQVEIVDLAATPGVPLGTGKTARIVFALLLGLGLAITAAYVVENYRPVIRRRDELDGLLSAPNLALVPQIQIPSAPSTRLLGGRVALPRLLRGHARMSNGHGNGNGNGNGKGASSAELVTINHAQSSGAEAYRTLRTNLLFSAAVRALRQVVVTSPGPAEGKSTTAANLAIAFAQQGQRVLLIDCDLRRSRIHKMFGHPQTPGLTNVLVGGTPAFEAIRSTVIDGLMVMPAGALPPNPAELLGSSHLKELLNKLSESYDLLILDSPPLLAASDAAILSRVADGALIIVRAGKTERSALEAAIQQLATVGARILGTVLNDPDAEVPKYAGYYGYYYNNYYEYSESGTA